MEGVRGRHCPGVGQCRLVYKSIIIAFCCPNERQRLLSSDNERAYIFEVDWHYKFDPHKIKHIVYRDRVFLVK